MQHGIAILDTRKRRILKSAARRLRTFYKPIWTPHMGGMDQWPEYNIHSKGSCSSCQALLAYGLERLKSLGEYDKNKGMHIVLGKANEILEGVDPNNMILWVTATRKHRGKGISWKAARLGNAADLEYHRSQIRGYVQYQESLCNETQVFRGVCKKKKEEIAAKEKANAAKKK